MAQQNLLGKQGEDLAESFLTQKGFTVLHRNWRHSHYEIDIIAEKGKVLHFVEVKLRSYKAFGMPEESVTKKKMKFLMQAADQFLYKHPQYKHIQFDILSINAAPDKEPECFFIEDVYL
jgi:putative endonuclease